MYSNYNYTVQNVDAEKKAIYNIYKYYDNKYYHQQFALKESKKFKVAFNINPQDEKFESLSNKYDKQNDILNWQNSKIKDEKINIYLEKLDNKSKFLFADINSESFFCAHTSPKFFDNKLCIVFIETSLFSTKTNESPIPTKLFS